MDLTYSRYSASVDVVMRLYVGRLEARLLRLRSKYLEPDSSSHQEPSFCPGFSQSSKDLFFSEII